MMQICNLRMLHRIVTSSSPSSRSLWLSRTMPIRSYYYFFGRPCSLMKRSSLPTILGLRFFGKHGTGRDATRLTPNAAKDFICLLTPDDRQTLLEELQKFQDAAAKTAASGDVSPPTGAQLRAVALHNALPFIGFGFLDNFIMIVAGDYIDTTIGLTLGISTMAAAGLGNALSDICGIGSAWYVENMASRIGVQAPPLSPAQIDMPRTRWSANFGRAAGVFIGCILGMFPLFFLPEKSEKIKENEPTS